MAFEKLLIEDKGATRIITINRPDQLNALNKAVISELNQAFTEGDQDASVRSIIVTGSGEKAFVAGGDIKELGKVENMPKMEGRQMVMMIGPVKP